MKRRIIYNSVRRTWTRKPQSQVIPDKKKYDRKREKERLRRGDRPDDGRFYFVLNA